MSLENEEALSKSFFEDSHSIPPVTVALIFVLVGHLPVLLHLSLGSGERENKYSSYYLREETTMDSHCYEVLILPNNSVQSLPTLTNHLQKSFTTIPRPLRPMLVISDSVTGYTRLGLFFFSPYPKLTSRCTCLYRISSILIPIPSLILL